VFSDKFSGGAGDWARAVAGIKYSFEIELPDRGGFGFLLPANYVEPVGEEIWSAVQVLATQIVAEKPEQIPTPPPLTDSGPGLHTVFSICAVITFTLVLERLRLSTR